jgi:hypothetical protein
MLPLLLLALVASVSAGDVDTLWTACQQDSICKWVFRDVGLAGMTRAATYNAEMIANARPFSYYPASWQAADVVNSTAQLLLERQLNGLVRYRAFIESATLTCLPGESVVYNPVSHAFACVCQPGHRCVTTADFTAATADALSIPTVLAIVATVVLLLASIAALVYLVIPREGALRELHAVSATLLAGEEDL